MSELSLKGVPVPSAGDPLLAAFRAAFDGAGLVVTVGSIAAARLKLDAALAAGSGPSAQSPWVFNVGSVFYVADGSKNSAGAWVLKAVNEVDFDMRTYTRGVSTTLTSGQYSGMASSILPVRPYRRLVVAFGQAWGTCTKTVDLALYVGGSMVSLSRFDAGDYQSQSVVNFGVIEAGETPDVRVGVRGGSEGGSITLSSDAQLNRLIAVAFPLTAA